MVILSFCLGVSQPGTNRSPGEIETSGFSPYDSYESLVFCDKISCHLVKGVPTNVGEKEGHPHPP